MLKPDCWVIKAQSNANSHARVVIPGKYLVPVSPRNGKHYSFSSKCNLFSELVSVWSSRILFSIISLDSVLLESTKPQGCLLQVTESDDEQLKNRSMFETSRNRTQLHKAKCSSEERAWSRWRKRQSKRSERSPRHCYSVQTNSTDPKASAGPNMRGPWKQHAETGFLPLPWLLSFSTLSPPCIASWPHTFPLLYVNTFTTQAHWALCWKITILCEMSWWLTVEAC